VSDPLLWTTAEVAELIRMSEDFVRDHAGELGGIRAGRGPRAPLRFEPARVREWIVRNRIANEAPRPDSTPGPRRNSQVPTGLDLLPLPKQPEVAAGR
jgi:hypothetical protein